MRQILSTMLILLLMLIIVTGCTPSGNIGGEQIEQTLQTEETQQTENTTDPPSTVPTTEIVSEPLFKFDKYRIPVDAQGYLTDREYALYCQLVDAVIAHTGVVEGFVSEDEFHKVWEVLINEFVPSRGMIKTYLNADEPYIYKEGTATVYFLADKDTCDGNYAAFENIINEALSLIQAEDGDWERIAKLYLYVSEHMYYGNLREEYGIEPNLYNSIVYELGMCTQYALYLNLLADHAGFETVQGSSLGEDGTGGADHAWSVICVDGQWYHFDACWQANSFPKEDMRYFAFSTEERYRSLSLNNVQGIPCELEMFHLDSYSGSISELPQCESGMPEQQRKQLYASVIEEILGVTLVE